MATPAPGKDLLSMKDFINNTTVWPRFYRHRAHMMHVINPEMTILTTSTSLKTRYRDALIIKIIQTEISMRRYDNALWSMPSDGR